MSFVWQQLGLAGVVIVATGFVGCSTTGTVSLPAPGGSLDTTIRGQSLDADDDSDGILGKWSPTKVISRTRDSLGYGPDQKLAQDLFDQGDAAFKQATQAKGDVRREGFLEAAKLFRKAVDRWPSSSIEEDSLFMLGECYFFADRYPKAVEAYNGLAKRYENTRYMDTVAARRFAISDYWIKHYEQDKDMMLSPNLTDRRRPTFDKFGNGVRVLDKIRLEDPTGKLADDATMRGAIANFEAGRYMRADELFADLRRSFPSSEHQFMAHLFGVRSKLKIYQGPSYSVQPMDEAEQLIRQIRVQFPDEAQKHEEFLSKSWREIRKNKALHDWSMAKYYDQRRDFGAARHYYAQIAENYSDTSLAQEASDRMNAIAKHPEKPEQKLPWLAKLFPTPEREKPLVANNPLDKLKR